jgi:excinuclease ABC subunit A
MGPTTIFIKGARVHNLKNIDLTLPKNSLVVITGLSGSGKSSLAFDTLYAEGQRRYVESLSAYARQFIGMMEKPDVDYIEGLSPAISIDQKTGSRNPRSTVGTMTEIYDYLRLLMARIGTPHCPQCGKEIEQTTIQQMVDRLMTNYAGSRATVLGPLARQRKGQYKDVIEKMRKAGYNKMRIDGIIADLSEPVELDKNLKHDLEVIVDRIMLDDDSKTRLADSLETALKLGEGVLKVQIQKKKDDEPLELTFSENFACPDCGIAIEEIEPRLFSFNSPYGACPACDGLGHKLEVAPELVVPDPDLSIAEGAIKAMGFNAVDGMSLAIIKQLAEHFGGDADTPWKKLPEEVKRKILYGDTKKTIAIEWRDSFGDRHTRRVYHEGIITSIERRWKQTGSDGMREVYEQYMVQVPCNVCGGRRLKPEALAVTINGLNIAELSALPILRSYDTFDNLKLTDRQATIARQILKEIRARLKFLLDVGLGYLNLSRASATLAGGEAQRLRLATQIGSGLGGVLYVLDEPSIGLHPRDNGRLLGTLKRLRDLGNTLVVVEHDEETIRNADFLVDIGPGAGVHGGHVVATGTLDDIFKAPESLTGAYLCGKTFIPVPKERREGNGRFLKVIGATEHNLKNVDISIPLGTLTVVTGVSGSGKSTLITDVLHKNLARELYRSRDLPGKCKEIQGIEYIDKVVVVDQSPIGRTPRSNPATYTGMFTVIRDIFSKLPESKARGYEPGRFSFNVKGGRCEACEGDGVIKIEMQFLPDVYVTCEVCKGRRFNRETLEIKFKGKNISEILDLTVEEALDVFENIPQIRRKLEMLDEVGLGYIRLGQQATTLSGGEAQRIKLTAELAKRGTGRTLYILDEPTTGLHMADVHKLVEVLDKLVAKGNTVLVIEHDLDVIKSADYVIDLGPEGGDDGGRLVGFGAPEEIAAIEGSYTGQYLKALLPPKSIGKVRRIPSYVPDFAAGLPPIPAKKKPRSPRVPKDWIDGTSEAAFETEEVDTTFVEDVE